MTTQEQRPPEAPLVGVPVTELDFNPRAQDYWDEVAAKARSLPHMPHFWGANQHAGIMRRADLEMGYRLLAESTGTFSAYYVGSIPGIATVLGCLIGLGLGLGADYDRTGGIIGPNDITAQGVQWSLWNTLMVAFFCSFFGFVAGKFIWQPISWYNNAWGDCLAIEEVGKETHQSDDHHQDSPASRTLTGKRTGTTAATPRKGHISAGEGAAALPSREPGPGNRRVAGRSPSQRARRGDDGTTCSVWAPGTAKSTDDPGRAYEAMRIRMRTQADRARAIANRGAGKWDESGKRTDCGRHCPGDSDHAVQSMQIMDGGTGLSLQDAGKTLTDSVGVTK